MILDTGAGPKVLRRTELADEVDKYIRHGMVPNKSNAHSKLLHMIAAVKLSIMLEIFLVHSDFTVCQILEAPVLFGADYYDRSIEAARPRKNFEELNDGSAVLIVRRTMKRPPVSALLPGKQQYDSNQERLTKALRAAETTSVPRTIRKRSSSSQSAEARPRYRLRLSSLSSLLYYVATEYFSWNLTSHSRI